MEPPIDEDALALFPGQGSISSTSGAPWRSCHAWEVVTEVSRATGVDVETLLVGTPNDALVRTDRAQLATFTLSLVGWRDYCGARPAPRFLAGHSLGEVTALVAAGVLTLADGARLVAARGTAMAMASRERPGTMVALMGPGEDAMERLGRVPGVFVANFNGPGQVVVSGTATSVAPLLADPRAVGWRRATALAVGGAFHSPLMAPAQDAFEEALDAVAFADSPHRIGSNLDGAWCGGGAQWRDRLARQLTNPVRFAEMIEALPATVAVAVELPPAGVLAGLTKRIRPLETVLTLEEPARG